MMKKSIPYIIIAILLTVLIMNFIRKSPPNEKLIRAEMEIEFKDREIKTMREDRAIERAFFDSVNTELASRLTSNQTTEKQIIYKYEKVPVYINSLNRDSLRAAVRHSVLSN